VAGPRPADRAYWASQKPLLQAILSVGQSADPTHGVQLAGA
jgi:hypothetical protein